MHYKIRTKPNELTKLGILNNRMELAVKDRQRYFNLKKGYEGELLFDSLTEKLQCECLILNDLLLTVNYTTFQVDTLIITSEGIHMYEVKNNEGDYLYKHDKLYKMPDLEIINPVHQLGRSESLLQRLLLTQGYKSYFNASIVFINSSFTMYQAPHDKPLIFPTQIKKHLSLLNKIPSKIVGNHIKLADQLISLHQTESSFTQLPPYDYRQLRKGITCLKCHSFLLKIERIYCTCQSCGFYEELKNIVLRGIEEFKILFPKEKLTTSIIRDWCNVGTEKRIRSILQQHFNKKGSRRWSYYE